MHRREPSGPEAGRFTREKALRLYVRAMAGAVRDLNELPMRADDVKAMQDAYAAVHGQPWGEA